VVVWVYVGMHGGMMGDGYYEWWWYDVVGWGDCGVGVK